MIYMNLFKKWHAMNNSLKYKFYMFSLKKFPNKTSKYIFNLSTKFKPFV